MLVREATVADTEDIARVQERGWQEAYRHVFPTKELDRGGFVDRGLWRSRLATPPDGWTTFVGSLDSSLDSEIVGFVLVGPSRDERGAGEVYAIYVEPRHWSTGAGRTLLARGEAQLARTFARAKLWVLEDNPRARVFYERAGWEVDGTRKTELRWGIAAAEVRYGKLL